MESSQIGMTIPITDSSKSPTGGGANFFGTYVDQAKGFGIGLKTTITETFEESTFGQALRSTGLLKGAEPPSVGTDFDVSWGQNEGLIDWRVKLSLPPSILGTMVEPLIETEGLVFPYTPQIMLQHSANYSPIKPVHSNYPFFAYQNSQVDQITITGDFYVESFEEGQYWLAAVYYLRAVTKMAYGQSENAGAPPPIVRLNGYGDYVFKNLSVVVTNFSVDFSPDIDYIFLQGIGPKGTYVPVRSTISVTLQPMFSRRKVREFSLQNFVNGLYISDDETSANRGFI